MMEHFSSTSKIAKLCDLSLSLFFFSGNLLRDNATLPVSAHHQVHLLEVIVVMGFVMSTVCP